MDAKKKRLAALVFFLSIVAGYIAVRLIKPDNPSFDINSIKSYRDIPGVTDDEIIAIETLKSGRTNFLYGSMPSKEAFRLSDGALTGFTTMFCGLLSDIFGIPFVHRLHPWYSLIIRFDERTVDFTGDLIPTPERRESYFMTYPIAERSLRLFTYGDAVIKTENDVNGLRIGFLEEGVSVQSILEIYPTLTFETVKVQSAMEAFEKLAWGSIDAFVDNTMEPYLYSAYPYVKSQEFFPLVHSPVSLATANPELEPVISVVNKYIAAGGIDKPYELYKAGNQEYEKYVFNRSLSHEEAAYIAELTEAGSKVRVALEHDNYPISFYNEVYKNFHGIAPDILAEISRLTGIEFEVATGKTTTWSEILESLETGGAALVSELQRSKEREKYFIWADAPYFTSRYILLSKADYPNLEIYQLIRATLGLVRGTVPEELYDAWFPGNSNTKRYNTQYEALDALERGDINLFMTSEYILLLQMNYREKPGYKANFVFTTPIQESFFGFNKNEEILRSIISKAQSQVNVGRIAKYWTSRVYDYSRKYANERLFYLSASAVLLLLTLSVLSVSFIKNVRAKELYREALQAAQEASRAKSNFLAKMSHEIRTPMNAIIGMTELALREEKLTAVHGNVLTVKQAGVNLLAIINDILDFSKIEMGKLEIIPGNYLFSSLINDVISIIRMRLTDSQVRFVVNIDSVIPNALIGDEMRIRQVLLNILSNAVKYTEQGFVSLSATGKITDENTVSLVFEVTDSGKGIRREDIEKLFDEYAQFDPEENKGIEGVGLGLAITRSIVKTMNGSISAASEYGKGSTFTVTLPQKFSEPEKLAFVEKPEEKSVLVFEHRKVYADSLSYTVENLGVACTIVSTESELYEKMSGHAFAFIFVSFTLYANNKEIISKFGANTRVVLLTEFGEAISDKNLSVLAMPAHCISIANILNGVLSSFTYSENHERVIRFTVPGAKVLVVDDVNTNLRVAEGLMQPYKMQLSLCKSGMEAIEAIKSERYDLVFMDHKMPGMDGIETTQRIRAMGGKEPYYKNVPIVALTANAVLGTKEMFLQNGFDDFLSKPVDIVSLNAVLEKWLPKEKQKKLEDE